MARRALRGALLMDMVVSTALLSCVAFLILNLFPSASLLMHQARFRGYALEWSRSVLEEAAGQTGSLPAPGKQTLPERVYDGIVFHGELEISPLAGEAPDQIVQSQCRVSWTDALGKHEVSYGSYLAARS